MADSIVPGQAAAGWKIDAIPRATPILAAADMKANHRLENESNQMGSALARSGPG
jgi:hypothetical protein